VWKTPEGVTGFVMASPGGLHWTFNDDRDMVKAVYPDEYVSGRENAHDLAVRAAAEAQA
jgi:hypothetical protein